MDIEAIRMRVTAQANPRTEAEIDRAELLAAYDKLAKADKQAPETKQQKKK